MNIKFLSGILNTNKGRGNKPHPFLGQNRNTQPDGKDTLNLGIEKDAIQNSRNSRNGEEVTTGVVLNTRQYNGLGQGELDNKGIKIFGSVGTNNSQTNRGTGSNNEDRSSQIIGESSLVIGPQVVSGNFGIPSVVSKALNHQTGNAIDNTWTGNAKIQSNIKNYYENIFNALDAKQTSLQSLNRGFMGGGVKGSSQSLNRGFKGVGMESSSQSLNREFRDGSVENSSQSLNRGVRGVSVEGSLQSLNRGFKGVDVESSSQSLRGFRGARVEGFSQSLDSVPKSTSEVYEPGQSLNSSLGSTSNLDVLFQGVNSDQSDVDSTAVKKINGKSRGISISAKTISGNSSGLDIYSVQTVSDSNNTFEIDTRLVSPPKGNDFYYPLIPSNVTGFQGDKEPEDDRKPNWGEVQTDESDQRFKQIKSYAKSKVKDFAGKLAKKGVKVAVRLGAKAAQQSAGLLSRLLILLADPRVLAVVIAIILLILIIWLIVSALQSTQTAASIERIELYMEGSSDAALNKFSIIIGRPVGASYTQDRVWKNAFEVDGPNGEFVKAINNIQPTFQFKDSTKSGTKNIKEVELKISLPVSNFKISNFDISNSRGLHLSQNVNNIIAICRVSDNCNPYDENTFKFSIKFDDEGLNLSDLNYVMQIFYTVSRVTFQDDKIADLSMNGIRICLGLISKGNISLVPCNVGANLVRTTNSNNTNTNNTGDANLVDVGGSFLCPFDVTQLPYLICTSGYFDTRFGYLHKAIDIAPQGLRGNEISIYSPVSGDVIYVYPKNVVQIRGGTLIKIKDERTGYIYTLAHLENERVPLIGGIDVSVGQKVVRGQFLGVLFEPNENTSRNWSTGAHLHFSIQEPNDTYIDPLPQFKAYCRLNDSFRCLR